MNTINLDTYIINNIISYVNIDKKIFINKYHYIESKKELKDKVTIIEKFYLKNKLRLEMIFDYLEYDNITAIRNYYILFYPKEYRQSFINSAILYLNSTINDNIAELIITIIDINNSNSININKTFINLINKLSINDLALLGW